MCIVAIQGIGKQTPSTIIGPFETFSLACEWLGERNWRKVGKDQWRRVPGPGNDIFACIYEMIEP